MKVGLDQSLWLLGNKQLTHYSATGTSLAALDLHPVANAEPKLFVVDDLGGVIWLAGEKELIQVDLAGAQQVLHRIALPDIVQGLVLQPKSGAVWVLSKNNLFAYDVNGTLTCNIELSTLAITGAETLVFDPAGDSIWVTHQAGVARFSASGDLLARIPSQHSGEEVSAAPFTLLPRLALLEPRDGLFTNNPTPSVALQYDALCNGQPCALSSADLPTYSLSALLSGQAVGNFFALDLKTGRAAYTPAARLPEGMNTFSAQARDSFGHLSNIVTSAITIDTVAPTITVISPANGTLTNQLVQTIKGSMSEPGTLTVNAQGVSLAPDGSVEAGARVRITNLRTGETVEVLANAAGAFSAQIAAAPGDQFQVIVVDPAGNASPPATVAVPGGAPLPPDPATVATPIDPTVPTQLGASTAFLYTGPNAIQTGVALGTIEARRAAVLRGRVLTGDNQPLPGVTITVLGHPEFGQTVSRADGMFDMAVNGGGALTVVYEKSGFLPVQRQAQTPWKDFVWLPDVIAVEFDARVATVNLATGIPQVAQGSVVTDADGTRQASILFPAYTTAAMMMPDGTSRSLDTLHVRATEFTIGPNGPKAMPASLPPSSAYTYAVDLSIDEAVAAGAKQVVFDQPLSVYVDNFLNFPAGAVVPVGYYDRDKGAWVASNNGRVIRILSITDGVADLGVDGTGTAASSSVLSAMGISDAERLQLAALYSAGKSLWRVPVLHFSTYDFNWVYHMGGGTPPGCDDEGACVGPEVEKDDDPCEEGGSIIEAQNQVLGERIPIAGTPFSLNYRSDRVPGYRASSTLTIPLSKSTVPSGLTGIRLKIQIAGQRFEQTFPPIPNQTYTFQWTGKDAYGRPVVGKQPATVQIGYVYLTQYAFPPPDFDYAAALAWDFPGSVLSNIGGRSELTVWRGFSSALDQPQAGNAPGLGGWSIDANHVYDRDHSTLLLGDGSVRTMQTMNVDTYAQPGFPTSFIPGTTIDPSGNVLVSGGWRDLGLRKIALDGTNGSVAPGTVYGVVASGADVYFSYASGNAINIAKLAPDGTISHMAGMGPKVTSTGPGVGPALSVVVRPVAMAADSQGNIYFSEQLAASGYFVSWVNRCYVKKLSTDGHVSIVAGDGGCWESRGDGGAATQARLYKPASLAVDSQGNLYIADEFTVRKVTPDGTITKVAGDGDYSYPYDGNIGDGGPATVAHLGSKTGSYTRSFNCDRQIGQPADCLARSYSTGQQ